MIEDPEPSIGIHDYNIHNDNWILYSNNTFCSVHMGIYRIPVLVLCMAGILNRFNHSIPNR